MRFTVAWLEEHLKVRQDVRTLAERLTMAGLEVDETRATEAVEGVVVGRIVEMKKHPNADRLHLCRVDAGGDAVEVVCGAPNARVGLTAPFAPPGARLGKVRIKRTRIRGVVSAGMLCSPAELDLGARSDGLLELEDGCRPGAMLSDYADLDDMIVKLDLTPNRSDCLSVRGIARELAAAEGLELDTLPPRVREKGHDGSINVRVLDTQACPRYLACVIKGMDTRSETPLRIRARLLRCGMQPVHPVVDVLNMLMLDLGQPMHAFDADKLQGGLEVRCARAGEKLTVLGGDVVEPADDTLVIADEKGPVALAGIIGGVDSAVDMDTTTVLLESAFFHPQAIAARARALRLHTESSHRFERGVDHNLQLEALQRAIALILELNPGAQAGPLMNRTEQGRLPAPVEIRVGTREVEERLGVAIEIGTLRTWFESLGCAVKAEKDTLTCTPPSWRFDLALPVDLIEEAGRFYGYDNIPCRSPSATVPASVDTMTLVDRMSDDLRSLGYTEVVTLSFTAPEMLAAFSDDAPAALDNPLAPELSAMRTSMLPNLAHTLRYNLNRGQNAMRIFECGKTYTIDGDGEDLIAGLIHGRTAPEQWGTPVSMYDLYDLKGDVETLLEGRGTLEFEPGARKGLHAGQAARVLLNGRYIGDLGALSPEAEQILDLPEHVFVFEIRTDGIPPVGIPSYRETSRYPSVRNDVSVVVAKEVASADLVEKIESMGMKDLKKVVIFDIFQGGDLSSEEKSVSLGLIYQSMDETLNNKVVAGRTERITQTLGETFNARTRT